ncbi:neuroligin-4, X-linked isoform X1 [Sigmodon hispidus]
MSPAKVWLTTWQPAVNVARNSGSLTENSMSRTENSTSVAKNSEKLEDVAVLIKRMHDYSMALSIIIMVGAWLLFLKICNFTVFYYKKDKRCLQMHCHHHGKVGGHLLETSQ